MSAEDLVHEALKDLKGVRVFADVADQGVRPPWIVYQVVGGEIAVDLGGTPFDKCCMRVQVAVWHETAKGRSSLMQEVLNALINTKVGAIPLAAPTNVFEHETRLHGSRIHVNVWSKF